MKTTSSILTALALLASQPLFAQHDHHHEAKSAAKPYPLDTCLVSGEKLGGMGKPVAIVHQGQEIKFCCSHCVPKFNKNPAKYLAKLQGGFGGSESMDHSGHNH